MHLRDALITTKGAILAQGAVEFEPDPSGLFKCPPHDHLIIDLSWALFAKIIPATAVRDPATGYFRARPVGGYFALPAALEHELRAGLARRLSDPVTARADHAEGILSSSVDTLTERHRKLGHCVLAMVKSPEAVEFRIEAELRASRPVADWNISAKDRWGDDGEAAGLSARFTVNSATSHLALGVIDPYGSPVVEREVDPFDGHEGVMLERSIVASTGLLIGGSPGGETWLIITGLDRRRGDREDHLWLRRTRLDRRADGLFEASDDVYWTFRCTAFTLQSVMGLIRRGERLRLSASGGCSASVATGGRDDFQERSFDSVTLSAFAAPSGVAIDIEASFDRSGASLPASATRIHFTLPRETLLVRYPRDHSRLYDPA